MSFSPNERNTLQLTGVGHFGCHLAMLVYPTAAVSLARQEQLALHDVLGWSFIGYLLFGLGALPVGFLADRFPSKWLLRIGVIGIGPALMIVATSNPGTMLVLALALVGLLASLYHPAGMSLLSRTIRNRGTGLGINGICGSVGLALAPIITEFLAESFGWRGAYLVIGLTLFALGLVVSFRHIDEPQTEKTIAVSRPDAPKGNLFYFGVLVVAMTLGGLAYRATSVAMPAYFEERIDFIGYGVASSLVFLAGSLGQYTGGRLADRHDLRLVYVGFQLLSLPLILCMAKFAGIPLFGVSAGFVFFFLGMQPVENCLVARFTPAHWRSRGYGLKFTAVFGVGAISVWGIEEIMERLSLAYVFMSVGGFIGFMIIASSFLSWLTRAEEVVNRDKLEESEAVVA